jgi:hypothetical protein
VKATGQKSERRRQVPPSLRRSLTVNVLEIDKKQMTEAKQKALAAFLSRHDPSLHSGLQENLNTNKPQIIFRARRKSEACRGGRNLTLAKIPPPDVLPFIVNKLVPLKRPYLHYRRVSKAA